MPEADYLRSALEGLKECAENLQGNAMDIITNHSLRQVRTREAAFTEYDWSDRTSRDAWWSVMDQCILYVDLDGGSKAAPPNTFAPQIAAFCEDLLDNLPDRR